jgi:hypothetical protein
MDKKQQLGSSAGATRSNSRQPPLRKIIVAPTKDSYSEESGEDDERDKKKVCNQIISMIGEFTMEELKNMHPQRNTFTLGRIVITSDFDGGNLSRAEDGDEYGCVSYTILHKLIVQSMDVN